jgi:hypothetical protein
MVFQGEEAIAVMFRVGAVLLIVLYGLSYEVYLFEC